jgi:myo-inositol-1(or 4)-monophosphatase
LVFVVDPLDGTTNFLHGYPAYAVSIGVLDGGVPAAAVVINAVNGDVFTARAGHGAYRNGQRIRVSHISDPARSLIGTGFPFKNLDRLDLYQRQFADVVRGTSGVRRAGSAALDLADVACGRFEGFWELSLMPWDFSAGAMLIEEAGGIVTGLDGGKLPLAQSGVIAGNSAMHAWLLRTLAT